MVVGKWAPVVFTRGKEWDFGLLTRPSDFDSGVLEKLITDQTTKFQKLNENAFLPVTPVSQLSERSMM